MKDSVTEDATITLLELDETIRSKVIELNYKKQMNIPIPATIGSRLEELVLFEVRKDELTKVNVRIKEYNNKFLYCINSCRKTCSNKFTWCDTLFKHDIEMNKYAIPTVDTNKGAQLKLNVFFEQWITSTDNYLALLANAGIGKTSACFYLISLVAKKTSEYNLLPVYIPLQCLDEFHNTNVYDLIFRFTNNLLSKKEIEKLIEYKQIVFILDGFDEIVSDSTLSSIITNFKSITPFLRFGCKTLLTCRTHYFAEENQIKDLLQGKVNGTDFAVLLLGDEYDFLLGELKEFSEEEIMEVIQLSVTAEDANKIWEDIKSIYDLKDLAKRAIILKMILKTLPELKKQSTIHKITAATLYRVYTCKLLKRELSERLYEMDITDMEMFIEYIASLMWSYRKLSINTHEFQNEIEEYYSHQISSVGTYIYSGKVSSFFIRDRHDNYVFCHKSFFEYYIARYCVRCIENDSYSGWDVKWFDKEIARFIADIIMSEHRKLCIIQLFKVANCVTDPIIIWNVLHILSLLDNEVVLEYLTEYTKNELIAKAQHEENCVIIRQYCRIIAKFINREIAEQLIQKIINIVRVDEKQNVENNETYFNYYNGKDAACNAFISHLNVPTPKYDAKLHLYLLEKLASDEYLVLLKSAIKCWSDTDYSKYSEDVIRAINAIEARIESQ